MYDADPDRDRALIASGDELSSLLHHPSTDVLLALLDNPAVDETQLFLLLNRKDLPAEILEEVARRKPLLKNYRVKRALAVHPRTPRLASLRLVRDLYPMDLVQLALLPGTPAELKRIAEDRLIGRLSQLPLGQKIALARRGPGRVAGALLAEGGPQVLSVVLDNPHLTEAQVLKVLSREKVHPEVVYSVIHHRKWSCTYNVRLALVRHPASTLSSILAYLPELTVSDLRELASPGIVSENLRQYLIAEIHHRLDNSNKATQHAVTFRPNGTRTRIAGGRAVRTVSVGHVLGPASVAAAARKDNRPAGHIAGTAFWRMLTTHESTPAATPGNGTLESLAGGSTGLMSSGDHPRRLERRWAPRYSFHADLEIEWGSALIRGRTRDISSNGMFIESADPLWVGAGFTARLGLEQPVKVDCFVKRVEPGRGMGVAVVVPEEQQQRYRELLTSLSSDLP